MQGATRRAAGAATRLAWLSNSCTRCTLPVGAQHLPATRRRGAGSLRTMAAAAGTAEAGMTASTSYSFGPHTIRGSEVFATTQLSFAFVNLKPVVPGHVLVSPKRVVKRFAELTAEEVSDLWALAQRVGSTLEPHYHAQSLTLAIQDGPAAGQTVPHVHVHILPRVAGDFPNNDQVYDVIDDNAKAYGTAGAPAAAAAAAAAPGKKLDLDPERRVRTPEEMAAEAAELRTLFP